MGHIVWTNAGTYIIILKDLRHNTEEMMQIIPPVLASQESSFTIRVVPAPEGIEISLAILGTDAQAVGWAMFHALECVEAAIKFGSLIWNHT